MCYFKAGNYQIYVKWCLSMRILQRLSFVSNNVYQKSEYRWPQSSSSWITNKQKWLFSVLSNSFRKSSYIQFALVICICLATVCKVVRNRAVWGRNEDSHAYSCCVQICNFRPTNATWIKIVLRRNNKQRLTAADVTFERHWVRNWHTALLVALRHCPHHSATDQAGHCYSGMEHWPTLHHNTSTTV